MKLKETSLNANLSQNFGTIFRPPKLRIGEDTPINSFYEMRNKFKQFGPSDVNDFALKKSMKIWVVCQKGFENQLNFLLKELEFGHKKNAYSKFDTDFPGFNETFKLKTEFPDLEEFNIVDFEDQEELDSLFIDLIPKIEQFKSNDKIPFVFSAIPSHKSIERNKDIYFKFKEHLLHSETCNQNISAIDDREVKNTLLSRFKSSPSRTPDIGYSLWNIACGLYGKAGGIPWTIDNQLKIGEKIPNLFIGIGFTLNSLTAPEKYLMSYSAIFDSWGQYNGCITHNLDEEYEFDRKKYFREGLTIPSEFLLEIVSKTYKRYKARTTVEPESIVITKKSNHQLEDVDKLNELLNQSNLPFDITGIDIQENTKLRGFNFGNSNLNVFRGSFIPLNNDSGFIWNTGDEFFASRQVEHRLGTPKPIMVSKFSPFPIKSNFNIENISRCMFELTHLNWKSISARENRLPISLEFASIITEFSKYGINPPEYSGKNTSLWFL